MKSWVFLFVAILSETIATSALKVSEGFTVFLPALVVVAGYSLSFYFLSLTLRTIPIGVAYAIWSGVGLALVTIIGWLAFNQKLDSAAVIGIFLRVKYIKTPEEELISFDDAEKIYDLTKFQKTNQRT